MHAYSYVLNNPLAYVDPSGLTPEEELPSDDQSRGPVPLGYYTVGEDGVIEVVVHGVKRKAVEDLSEAAEVGATTVPTDVNAWGNSASFAPAQGPTEREVQSTASIAGEIGLGVLDGVGELVLQLGKTAVLNALTLGGYSTYGFGSAMWEGYQEDGLLGALNAVNPLYQVARGGADTYLAAERGDYRAAGASGATTAILAVTTVVGIAEGVGALTAEAGLASEGAAAAAAARERVGPTARFIADDVGNIVDTQATPPGRYIQPDRSATDILQDAGHPGLDPFTSRTHTHQASIHLNPSDPTKGVTRLSKDPRPVTFEEVINIMTAAARRGTPRGH